MIVEQVEENLEQELELFWWGDYWDAVYQTEEECWQAGEAIKAEPFGFVKSEGKISDPHLLIL
ncbi:hypothetical protein IFO70_31350 [Phormidium tenue FACHB-886]|nr:hypothetical protein [Phormidium tenue FACHB-886]